MKIGGGEEDHSWLDANVPGRRRSNDVRRRRRADRASKRKRTNTQPPAPKKNTWSLW